MKLFDGVQGVMYRKQSVAVLQQRKSEGLLDFELGKAILLRHDVMSLFLLQVDEHVVVHDW